MVKCARTLIFLLLSVILFTLFIYFYFFDLIIIMTCVFLLLWLTSYYAILAYCVLCAIIWVGGVDVCNLDCPLFVCACFVDTPVCVLHAGCLNDN